MDSRFNEQPTATSYGYIAGKSSAPGFPVFTEDNRPAQIDRGQPLPRTVTPVRTDRKTSEELLTSYVSAAEKCVVNVRRELTALEIMLGTMKAILR